MFINFNKEDGVHRREEQADVELDPDEEETEDARIYDKRECHWRMFFEKMMEG